MLCKNTLSCANNFHLQTSKNKNKNVFDHIHKRSLILLWCFRCWVYSILNPSTLFTYRSNPFFGFQSRALASEYSGESNSARVCMRYLALHCSYVLIHFNVPWLIFLVESITPLLGACNSHAKPMSRHFSPQDRQFLFTGVRIGKKDCFSEEVSLKFTSCLWLTHWGLDRSVKKLWPEYGVTHYDSLRILKQWKFSCSCCLHLILLCLLMDVCVSLS